MSKSTEFARLGLSDEHSVDNDAAAEGTFATVVKATSIKGGGVPLLNTETIDVIETLDTYVLFIRKALVEGLDPDTVGNASG